MTHGFSSTDKSKKPMNCYYDFSTSKLYAYDSNEELQEITIGGGGAMKCAKFGTVLPTTTGAVIDISDLNLTSAEDYMVVCDGTGYSQGTSQNSTVFIEDKTATSFTIKAGFAAPTNNNLVSYQVITFK